MKNADLEAVKQLAKDWAEIRHGYESASRPVGAQGFRSGCESTKPLKLDNHFDLAARYILIDCKDAETKIRLSALLNRVPQLERVLELAEELCDAVDAQGQDIGGHRGSLIILGELGGAVEAARK